MSNMEWHVRVVLDNEQDTQEHVAELARQARHDPYPRAAMKDAVKDYVEEMVYGEGDREYPPMVQELLGAAMSEVDWYSIAETYLGDEDE